MSKSHPDPRSRILLTDTYEEIKKKIKASKTDSLGGVTFDMDGRPGTGNLLSILAACEGSSSSANKVGIEGGQVGEGVMDPAEIAKRYEGKGHGVLKADVIEAVELTLRRPREEYLRIRKEVAYLDKVAKEGAEKAKEMSGGVLSEVRRRVGLT